MRTNADQLDYLHFDCGKMLTCSRTYVISATNANTVNLATVGSIKSLQFTFVNSPRSTEQQEIVQRVEALFKTVDALEARYLKAKAHVDKLTQSILAKAFRGELVPQDPNDEPAGMLLERMSSNA